MENLVAIELAYINTKHPDFHKDAALVSSLMKHAELDQPKHKRNMLLPSANSSGILPTEMVNRKVNIPFFHSLSCFLNFFIICLLQNHLLIFLNQTFIFQGSKSNANRDEALASVTEQPNKEQPQQNHWFLGNLLPQSKSESVNSTDGSPVRGREDPLTNSNTVSSPQQKPVNLLPEVPTQTSRMLSDREQRDCDVIGRLNLNQL